MSSSDGERSPKRQRLESYSPASPLPTSEPKQAFVPNTPPPSIRMSPSWQAQSQNTQNQPGGSSSNFPSPPSTAGFHNRMAERDTGGESSQQTPASQDDGEVRKGGDGDAEMRDRQEGDTRDHSTVADKEHRRSDHERQRDDGAVAAAAVAAARLYKLPITPCPPSQPHATQNLIELYGLQSIQQKVARKDPITGEKINKMRKSYATKVKDLGLEGKNKAVSNQGELAAILDPDWNAMTANGSTWWDERWQELRLDDEKAQAQVLSKLDSALHMEPGRLPAKEHEEWKSTLGLDDSASLAKAAPAPSAVKQPAINAHLAKTAPAAAARGSAPSSPRNGIRPDRTGKKRSYRDSSFEGYNDGFEDDGYSTGGVDDTGRRRDSTKRQKRKVSVKDAGFYAVPGPDKSDS